MDRISKIFRIKTLKNPVYPSASWKSCWFLLIREQDGQDEKDIQEKDS